MYIVRHVISLFGALALVLLLYKDTNAQADQTDPALRNPVFAEFARQHPADWEQLTDPRVKPLIIWQRLVGGHALVIGWANEQANPGYSHPRVVIDIIYWDGSDLFALGLPRTYNNKPVVIQDLKEIPQAGGLSSFQIPPPAPGHTGSPNTGNAANAIVGVRGQAASIQYIIPVQMPQTGGGSMRSITDAKCTNTKNSSWNHHITWLSEVEHASDRGPVLLTGN